MSQLLYGSINLSELNEQAKKGHKAFSRGKNGKIYFNVNVWINDEPDQYNNDASVQLNFKDATKDDQMYIGNLKKSSGKPISPNSVDIPNDDDLPI
ncbi:hypothetical protein [Chishuiella sp.]|uniref:hypothetical protein n=1 Tax=Chishuiella sp. TaxID=1969467 RepID=UPI0028B1BDAC|nr:hypothetical protein [Chishuiella sp.]